MSEAVATPEAGTTVPRGLNGDAEAATTSMMRVLRHYESIDTGSGSLRPRTRRLPTRLFVADVALGDIGLEQLIGRIAGLGEADVDVPSENASEVQSSDRELPGDIEILLDRQFTAAHEEQFEPGMESDFARGLDRLFRYASGAVLNSLKARLSADTRDPEVLAELLRWVGRQNTEFVRGAVVDLLSDALNHSSSLVRDAAAMGLASLRDPVVIPHLMRAIEKETVPELQEDLKDLVSSLEL